MYKAYSKGNNSEFLWFQCIDPNKASSSKYSSALHFAAKHGLSRLCQRLLTWPGALQASLTMNRNKEMPSLIARKAGHKTLADYLEYFVASRSYFINSFNATMFVITFVFKVVSLSYRNHNNKMPTVTFNFLFIYLFIFFLPILNFSITKLWHLYRTLFWCS